MHSIGLYLSSDDEYENASAIRYRQIRDASNMFALPDVKFLRLFRLSKPAVKYLIDELDNALPIRSRSTSIPNSLKIAAMLRYCAHGSYQGSVGQDFLVGMSQSTVSKILTDILSAIEDNMCRKWVSFRQTERDKELAAEHFYHQTGFPGVIGCVDGTHINIVRPIENEHIFFNRKGKHSINTMIACNHQMRIMAVDARYGGASHDSFIWNLSSYREHLHQHQQNTNNSSYWLLGDSGYPLEPWILTPFRLAAEGSREASFNTIHSKTRNIIERCIGVLKARFRCLLGAREMHYAPIKVSQIINVCAMLHNICLHFNVPFEIQNETVAPVQDPENNSSAEPENNIARRMRQNILESIT